MEILILYNPNVDKNAGVSLAMRQHRDTQGLCHKPMGFTGVVKLDPD